MLPNTKVQDLINRHSKLEKELSSGDIDKKSFAEKSKEYSNLNDIIQEAKEYSLFEKNRCELEKIINDSKTVLWNGPAGYFENPNFEKGTRQILEIISRKTKSDKIFSVAGGGETVAAINKYKKLNSFTFVSTAGGAFLEFLEGKTLPGIKAIN